MIYSAPPVRGGTLQKLDKTQVVAVVIQLDDQTLLVDVTDSPPGHDMLGDVWYYVQDNQTEGIVFQLDDMEQVRELARAVDK